MTEWLELSLKVFGIIAPILASIYGIVRKLIKKYVDAQERIARLKQTIITKAIEEHKKGLEDSLEDHKKEVDRWVEAVKFHEQKLKDLEIRLSVAVETNGQTMKSLASVVKVIREENEKIRQGQALILKTRKGEG